MAERSPTNLNTSRNIALEKGTMPAGFAEPNLEGFKPMAGDDPGCAAQPSSHGTAPPAQKPFTLKGA